MQTNTLVRHTKLRSAGIGCIAKVMKASVKVNFGTEDVMTCKPKMLELVDTSGCKTVTFQQFRSRIMMVSKRKENNFDYAIVGNELKNFVGIGWVTLRVVTEDDLKKYPRVV